MNLLLVSIFWLLLLIPGAAIAQRFDRDRLEDGGFLVLGGASLVWSALVLAPIAVICFWIGLPLWIFTAWCAIAVAGGLALLVRDKAWRPMRRVLLTGLAVELAVMLVDLVLAGRVGAMVSADAVLHVSRVRYLLDHGLNNYDHFVGPPYWYPVYHTNLLYALIASCAQATRLEPILVWHLSLPMAKAAILLAAAQMAHCIVRRPWAPWLAAMFILGARGPVPFLLYPNQLAPWCLIPLIVGFAVRACVGPCRWIDLVRIVGLGLVLGTLHGMYGGFALLAIGPLLAGAALLGLVRRRDDRWRLALTGALLLISAGSMPFASRLMDRPYDPALIYSFSNGQSSGVRSTEPAESSAPADVASDQSTIDRGGADLAGRTGDVRRILGESADRFLQFDNGWVMLRWGIGWHARYGWKPALFIAALVVMFILGRRGEAVALLAVAVSIWIWLHTPLCTLLLRGLGADWMALRLAAVLDVLTIIVLPAAAALALDRASRFAWLRPIASLAALGLGAWLFAPKAPYDWPTYWRDATQPVAARRAALVRPHIDRGRAIEEFAEPGAVIAAPAVIGMRSLLAADGFIIAPVRGSLGVPNLGMRRRALYQLFDSQLGSRQRAAILDEWNARYVMDQRPVPAWAIPLMSDVRMIPGGFYLFEYAPDAVATDAASPGWAYGQALLDAGQSAAALQHLARVVERSPNDPAALLAFADALRQSGRFAEALDALRRAERHSPDDPRIDLLRAACLIDQGDVATAVRVIERTAPTPIPSGRRWEVANAYLELGRSFNRQRQWEQAIAVLERSMAISQADPVRPRLILGFAQEQLGRTGEAVETYLEAWRRQSSNAEPLVRAGRALARAGDLARAEQLLRRAADVAERSGSESHMAYAYLNLGQVFAAQQRWDAARRAFERVLEIDPSNESARSLLEQLDARIGADSP